MWRISIIAGILQSPESSSKLSCCLHTAEVAGSNPASPTKKYLQMAEKCKPPVFVSGAVYCNRTATGMAVIYPSASFGARCRVVVRFRFCRLR